jgi:hypothetical protein
MRSKRMELFWRVYHLLEYRSFSKDRVGFVLGPLFFFFFFFYVSYHRSSSFGYFSSSLLQYRHFSPNATTIRMNSRLQFFRQLRDTEQGSHVRRENW